MKLELENMLMFKDKMEASVAWRGFLDATPDLSTFTKPVIANQMAIRRARPG
jgi:hypothetical protein